MSSLQRTMDEKQPDDGITKRKQPTLPHQTLQPIQQQPFHSPFIPAHESPPQSQTKPETSLPADFFTQPTDDDPIQSNIGFNAPTQQIALPLTFFQRYNRFVINTLEHYANSPIADIGSEHDSMDFIKLFLVNILPSYATDAMFDTPTTQSQASSQTDMNTVSRKSADQNPLLISLTLLILCALLTCSILSLIAAPFYWRLSAFSILCISMHLNEFTALSIHHPNNVSYRHFCLWKNVIWGSRLLHVCEHLIISTIFDLHTPFWNTLSFFGLALSVIGLALRATAIHHAGVNFQYDLMTQKEPFSTLVRTGIYSLVRHPSYSALWLAQVGYSLLLITPLCLLSQGLVSFSVLQARCDLEEKYLIDMFGNEYRDYQAATPRFIPSLNSLKNILLVPVDDEISN